MIFKTSRIDYSFEFVPRLWFALLAHGVLLLILTEPKFSIEIPETDFVVLPAPHKVFLGLDVVADLEDDPAAALGLEIAVDSPGALRQVRGVNEVHARLAGALRRLNVVARESDMVGS